LENPTINQNKPLSETLSLAGVSFGKENPCAGGSNSTSLHCISPWPSSMKRVLDFIQSF
jgi:hypothetical protein